ncbi:MAG: guanylate cyclase [Nitrosomonadales bacterium]|nr:guanylate cyclase [Nitrosomonadales bacterium]
MNEGRNGEGIPDFPSQDNIQEILHKVIIAHQQALALLQQTETAYGRLVPHQLLNLLEAKSIVDVKLGDQVERKMTIMFSDIRDFTPLSESMTPAENFEFINSYLSQMEPVISRHHGIIDKYIGDAIMALFEKGADEAVSGAIAMLERLSYYNAGRERAGYAPVQIGIGLNTGVVMIGTVGGINRMDSTVIGDAVNLTARLEEATKTYHAPLIISQNTLYDLADPGKYDIRFLDRIRVKGKSQPLSVYEVFDNNPEELRDSKRQSLAMFEKAVAYYHMQDIAKAVPLLKQCIAIAPEDYPSLIYLERCHEFQTSGQHHGTGELQTVLSWKEGQHTGLPEVDNANRILMYHINTLTAKIEQNECRDFADIFPFLRQHAQHLFPIEESLMRQHAYQFADGHIQEHRRFVQNLSELEKMAANKTEDPRLLAFRTQLLLLDWFASHATKADRHFSRFTQNSKAR